MDEMRLYAIRNDVRKRVEPYLGRMLEIHGDNIVSIILYGSATGKDFSPKTSDINLLVVFKELDFHHLNKSLKLVSSGIQKKIAAPLFLSRTHIDTSKDVFPVEFLEFQENHILLYGQEVFKDMHIEVRRDHVRLFCEQQIKGKLIRLRQAYLEVGLKKKGIEALMKESLYGLMPIFRALIRLKGATPPVDKEGIATQLAEAFDLDKNVFIMILRDKRDDERIAGEDVTFYFEKYIAELKKLALAVDKL